mmetsp:Transcript_30188/g.60346  ORF Transcript_30188/g.60346 Transcript_30188/m.60346 type:complete len:196 (-) Transcript_30188:271-858(-)
MCLSRKPSSKMIIDNKNLTDLTDSRGNLIVDFPRRRRDQSHPGLSIDDSTISTDDTIHKTKSQRSVRFASLVKVIIIERCSQEQIDQLWTTMEERKESGQRYRADIQAARQMLALNQGAKFTAEQRDQCIGIEKMLSSSMAKRSNDDRRRILQAVTAEQRRQDDLGIFDAEALRRVSETYSGRSMMMAQKYAEFH